jgi:hypothetical protein
MKHTLPVLLSAMLAGTVVPIAAQDCKSIPDSLERLRCYDGTVPPAAAQNPSAPLVKRTPSDDPLVAKAKAAVRKQLREPGSAQFSDIKIKSSGDKKGVCGMVNAKNGTGGMTGTNFFVFDGEYASILVTGGASQNPTSFGPDILSVTISRGLKNYEAFCGKI